MKEYLSLIFPEGEGSLLSVMANQRKNYYEILEDFYNHFISKQF